jgi:hypothetical protein
MNILYTIYFTLPNFARIGIAGKAINRILGMALKRLFDLFMPWYLKRTADRAGYGLNTEKREETYVVSLTSFPARIGDIWITIETLLRQSFKPDKIILWLGEEQFPDKMVPETLTRLKHRGLSIEFCEDLRSHKKYYFAMQKYPEANIITVDDDLYYPSNLLKNLVELHRKYPKLIATNRAHLITFNRQGIKPYRKWQHNVTVKKPSFLLLPTGCSGTLYPPGALHPDVFNKDVFKTLCFYADDLWLKVMALKKGTAIITNRRYNKDFVSVGKTQREKLVFKNVFSGGNDEQLKNVLGHYSIDLKKEIKKLERTYANV